MIISPVHVFRPVYPEPYRTYCLLKYLSQRHEVVLISPPAKGESTGCNLPIAYYEIGARSRIRQFFDPKFIARVAAIIKRERPDVLQVEYLWPGFHGLMLRLLTGVPFVLDEHNVEYLRRRRMGSPIWGPLYVYETITCRQADMVMVTSEVDKEALLRLGTSESKLEVVPNGTDTDFFFPSDSTPSYDHFGLDRRPTALFFGTLEYMANRQAVDIIQKELLPRVVAQMPAVRFLIVGRNPQLNKSGPNVIFTGAVERVQDFINAADVTICPIMVGGGTRVKILDSLACGRQVISTTIGAEGLRPETVSFGLTIADKWDDFATAIVNALRAPRRVDVSDLFLETYSWNKIAQSIPYNAISHLNRGGSARTILGS